jgi:hypothetical protein
MLETLRSFAAARLDEAGEAAQVRRAHAVHFARLAADSEEGMARPEMAAWTRRLEAALADLDVALQWADENDGTDLGLAMSAALWRWWLVSGRLAAGRAWLATFLARAGQRRDELAGRALCSAAELAAENGRPWPCSSRSASGSRWRTPRPWSARRTATSVTAPPPGAASRPRWTCGRRWVTAAACPSR